MNLNHLAVFYAVAEEGSVTRAANRLHISQPAVSKQLRDLEKSVGAALFHRLSTGVRLTDAGELLHGYARQMFALEDEAQSALRQLRALERGRLRVGASTLIADYVLPRVCARFHRAHPGVELRMEVVNSREVARRLKNNAIEVALVDGPDEWADLHSDVWGDDALVAIAPPEHPLTRKPLTPQELSRAPLCAPLLLREEGSGVRAGVEAWLFPEGQPARAVSLGSHEAIRRAVVQGMGVAVLPARVVESDLQGGQLVALDITGGSPHHPLRRLRVPGSYESRAAREFWRLLRAGEKEAT